MIAGTAAMHNQAASSPVGNRVLPPSSPPLRPQPPALENPNDESSAQPRSLAGSRKVSSRDLLKGGTNSPTKKGGGGGGNERTKVLLCGEERVNANRDRGVLLRCVIIAGFSTLGLLLSIAALAEAKTEPKTTPAPTHVPSDVAKAEDVEVMYSFITILTGIATIAIVEFYVFEWRMTKEDCKAMNIKMKSYWLHNVVPLTIELLIHLPHPIPTHGWEMYSLFFMSAMFARVYTLLRVVAYNHLAYPMRFDIFGPQAVKFPKVKIQWPTLIKVVFLQNPMLVFLIVTWYVVLWGSFTVYIAERSVWRIEENGTFDKFSTAMWFIFVTMATIGYGDMTPWTTLGKLAAVGAGLLGIVLANMIAAILALKFKASPAESEIMNHLLKYRNRGDLERESSNVIKFFFVTVRGKFRKPSRYTKRLLPLMGRVRMITAIQKAKLARNILSSLVSDDARLSTDITDILDTVRNTSVEQQAFAKVQKQYWNRSSRQFDTVRNGVSQIRGHLELQARRTQERLDGFQPKLATIGELCDRMLVTTSTICEKIGESEKREAEKAALPEAQQHPPDPKMSELTPHQQIAWTTRKVLDMQKLAITTLKEKRDTR